ncbi:hypothetical protein EKK58_09410 [Candidatus Dependentiae bacterium]|nr:MAG: hypothetical protein EKK58_09410 [Candidatus Dependentiae bacterium]
MTKTIDDTIRQKLYEHEIGFSMANAGNRNPEQMVELLVDDISNSILELIKEAEPKAPTEARHNDKFDTVYDAAYTNGVNAYSEQISNLFNKEEKEESNDFI